MRGGDRDLKIEALRGGVRDLKIDDAAAMREMKEGVRSEGVGSNEGIGLLAMKSWKEAIVASEAADGRDLKRPKEGEILRLKKEMNAAWDLWILTSKKLRNAATQEEEATQEKAQQVPGDSKKRKKVVKVKLRDEYVEHMRACPFSILADYSDEELARSTPFWRQMRQMYAAGRFLEAKSKEYWNALIAQKDALGYAEDENEVTDDDDEEEVVVKN